mgnify:CR=1 FL=1
MPGVALLGLGRVRPWSGVHPPPPGPPRPLTRPPPSPPPPRGCPPTTSDASTTCGGAGSQLRRASASEAASPHTSAAASAVAPSPLSCGRHVVGGRGGGGRGRGGGRVEGAHVHVFACAGTTAPAAATHLPVLQHPAFAYPSLTSFRPPPPPQPPTCTFSLMYGTRCGRSVRATWRAPSAAAARPRAPVPDPSSNTRRPDTRQRPGGGETGGVC